jgi:hypothetical protein
MQVVESELDQDRNAALAAVALNEMMAGIHAL